MFTATIQADSVGNCQSIIAFMYTVAVSEGTYNVGDENGYNVIVGSTPESPILFEDYSHHPNRLMHFDNGMPDSTAAGRYQTLYRFAIAYIKQLKLPDFGPLSQDRICLQYFRETGVYNLLKTPGNFLAAVKAANGRWASFPGNTDGQHQQKIATLQNAFTLAGGV